jgi:hypothetical protein
VGGIIVMLTGTRQGNAPGRRGSALGVAGAGLTVLTLLGAYLAAGWVERVSEGVRTAVRADRARFPALALHVVDGPHVAGRGADSIDVSWTWLFANRSDTLTVLNGRAESISCGNDPWTRINVAAWSGGQGYAVLQPGGTAWMRLEMRVSRDDYVRLKSSSVDAERDHGGCRVMLHFAGPHRPDGEGGMREVWGPVSRNVNFLLRLPEPECLDERAAFGDGNACAAT